MTKRTEKRTYTVQDEECTGRNSERVGSEVSADSENSVDGQDVSMDGQSEESEPESECQTLTGNQARQRQTSDSESEHEPGPSSPAKITRNETRRGRGRGRGRGGGRGRGAVQTETVCAATDTTEARWCGVEDQDITPTPPAFCPSRSPGCQLNTTQNYSVLELFQLFFNNSVLQTLVNNTNEFGRATSETWTDITLQDMFSFLSIVVYMSFMKASSLTDYWQLGPSYSFPFPRKVISGKKFLAISRALHLSSAEDDTKNEEKRATTNFDRLGKIKPLYTEIREACRTNYQPNQHISIDERMVASEARAHFKQYIKPTRWGFKLFVLADSETGYTWDFFVYEGKSTNGSGKGLGYDSVMRLIDTSLLGTGYKLYVDNFYTSPTLFRDLLEQKIWSCGTIRPNLVGFPKTNNNALDQRSPRGSIRWIREDSLLFVQWRDTRDMFLCSTIHTAHDQKTIERRMKDDEGHWTVIDVPLPPAIKDYNKHMGGVDLSDHLIRYYNVLHKTRKWYKTFFYHFLDIAIVNAFILYKAFCKEKGQMPMHQKAFRETLVLELSKVGSQRRMPHEEAPPHHRLVHISGDKTDGRLKCRKCHAKTAVKCGTCNMPLCFVSSRDCYNEWHVENNM